MAASSWASVVTLWSSKGQMDQLFSLNIQNYDTSLRIRDIKVSDGRKSAIIWSASENCPSDASWTPHLLALEMGADGTWNTRILCDGTRMSDFYIDYKPEMQKAASVASTSVLIFGSNCANFWTTNVQRLCNC